jgi:hypothetical protein
MPRELDLESLLGSANTVLCPTTRIERNPRAQAGNDQCKSDPQPAYRNLDTYPFLIPLPSEDAVLAIVYEEESTFAVKEFSVWDRWKCMAPVRSR